MVLRAVERKIEALFEGIFGRAFRTNVQPVELARKLAKEMDDHRTVSVSRVYVPNEYTVYLSPGDREQFESYEENLRSELQEYLSEHARRESYALLSPVRVLMETDDDLDVGEFGIATRMVHPERRRGAEGEPPAEGVGLREFAALAAQDDHVRQRPRVVRVEVEGVAERAGRLVRPAAGQLDRPEQAEPVSRGVPPGRVRVGRDRLVEPAGVGQLAGDGERVGGWRRCGAEERRWGGSDPSPNPLPRGERGLRPAGCLSPPSLRGKGAGGLGLKPNRRPPPAAGPARRP